jgi:hypothetical protein
LAACVLYHKPVMILDMDETVRQYLARIGRCGGQKSRRILEPQTAREMVSVREARRAYRDFHTRCFWSCDPEYKITVSDLAWVAEQLMKYGGHAGWRIGARLCR